MLGNSYRHPLVELQADLVCKHNVIVACVFEIETLLARRRLQTEPHQHNWGGVAKRLRQEPAKL